MISDYSKTRELVDSAYNSTGASQRQFEKTLDSLQAKLTKLKNAWDEFTMGLANNELIGLAVEGLTKILELVNGIINGLSGGNGLIKSVMTLGAVIGGLKLGGSLFDKLLSKESTQNFIKKFRGEAEKTTEKSGSNSTEKKNFFQRGKEAKESFMNGFSQAKQTGITGEFLKESFFGVGLSDKYFDDFKNTFGDEIEKLNANGRPVFEDLTDSVKRGETSLKDYQNQLEQITNSSAFASEATLTLQDSLNSAEIICSRTGKTVMAAGGAFMALGAIVSEINPELGKVISTIGGIGTAVGGLIQAMPSLAKEVNGLLGTTLSVPQLAVILAGITAIALIISAVVKSLKENSLEAKLEKAKEATDKAKKSAEEASKAYDDLVSKKDSLDDMSNKLESLTKGSLEWKKALVELNNEVLSLKESYKELEIEADSNGQLQIKNYDVLLKKQLEYVQNTSDTLAMSEIREDLSQMKSTGANGTSQPKELFDNASSLSGIGALTESNKELADNLLEIATKTKVVLDTNESRYTVVEGEEKKSAVSILSKIEDKATKEVSKIKDKENREKAYEEYYGKGSAEGKEDDEIKQALISQKMADNYNEMLEKVSSFSPEMQKKVQFLSGSSDMSYQQILARKSGPLVSLSAEDKTLLAETFGLSEDEIQQRWNEARTQIIQNATDLQKDIGNLGLGNKAYTLFSEYGLDVAKGLADQVRTMSSQEAEQYLSNFSKMVADSDLSESEQDQLKNYLSSVDLTDMVDVSNARDFMESLGMDKDKIAQFWGEANKYCKAYISSLEEVDTLNSKITNLGSARELVSEGQTSFSSDEKATLISAGFQEENFVQTGFDEWTYAVGDTNTLLQQIDEKVGIISNQIVGGLKNGIELGKKYKGVIESDDTLKSDLETLAQYGANGTSFSKKELEAKAGLLGIDTTNLNKEGIAQALIDAYNLYKNLGTNIEAVERQQMNSASLQYEMNGDFGIYTDKLTDDQRKQILQAQLNKNAGAQELYNKLLKESGDTTGKFNQKLADQAIQLTKTTQKYKEVASSIDDYKDALLQGESAGTDFYTALNSAKKDLSELFNVDSSLISDEFIQQYAQDIYNLAEGGEVGTQAFKDLQSALAEIQFNKINEQLSQALPVQFKELVNYINELDPTLEVKTLVDDSPLNNALLLMAQNIEKEGKNATEVLAPVLASIEALTGTSLNLQWEYEYCGLPGTSAEEDLLKKQGWQVDPVSKRRMRRTKGLKTSYSSNTISSLKGLSLPDRSSSSGSSGSDKKDSTWENPYDKLYNLTEEINEALRQREKLEREYDRILERRGSTFGELRKNYNSQINSLKEEIRLQEQLRAGRLKELNELSSETYKGSDSDGNELIKSFSDWGVTKYANYNPNTGVITIDWDAIDRVKDENTGGAIEAYISRLEELQEQIEDVDTQIEDFEDKVLELQKEGMQDYLDFEQKVYDAIVNQQQELIDNFQSLSDELAESNQEILDSIQDSIDLQRQIRDNTQTEEDINEKEARLAYLRRDTSNANLLEIKQLEDELADSRQDYEDSLIDQQLERLSKQNDDAQTAREKQIELMQAQLDYSEKNGEFWNQAYELIGTGFSADGDLNQASQLWDLLEHDEGWKGMSKFGQLNWQEEISKAILSASNGYANWNMYKAEKVDKSLTTGNGRKLTYDGKQWKDSSGNIYNGVDYDSTTGQFTYSGMTAVKKPSSSGSSGSGSNSSSGSVGVGSRVRVDSGTPIYSNSYGGGAGRQYYANDPIYNVLDENNGYYLVRYHKLGSGYTGWFKKSDVKAYKKGGLADFTGPAWLDGTKSSPELILNARDTENFIELKNILGSLMKTGTSQTTSNSVGDMYFDININVDEISNDYDVEQLGKKIKQDITNDAMYRNVNLINLIR